MREKAQPANNTGVAIGEICGPAYLQAPGSLELNFKIEME